MPRPSTVQGLHAKVCVIDRRAALVTSANATRSGMGLNVECGLWTEGEQARTLDDLARRGFGVDPPPRVCEKRELRSLQPAVDELAASHALTALTSIAAPDITPDISVGAGMACGMAGALSGRRGLTFECLLHLPQEFSLDHMYQIGLPAAAARCPNNRHPRDKLRQQLQVLRDLGLVEFLGSGRYRRTMVVR